MTPVNLTFKHNAETKNKQRFEEEVAEGGKPVVGTLYVSKEIVGDAKSLQVTIAPAA